MCPISCVEAAAPGYHRSLMKIVLVVMAFVAALVLSGPAAAQVVPLEDTALIDQYKETIPTASGPKLSGGGSGGGSVGGTPLPPAVVTELHQAVPEDDARRLEEVATSPRYGAPLHAPDEGGLAAEDDAAGPFSAAVTAVAGEGGGSLLPLVLALVFATGALAGAAVYRRRGPIV
jgi:hypothetical protein